MEIFVLLGLTGVVWLFGLAMVMGLHLDLRSYALYSVTLGAVGLAVFEWGSLDLGLVRIGEEYSLSIPRDYIERGISGTALIGEGVLAVLSPLFAAILSGLRATKPS